jgi:hypothetical protein
MRNIFSALALGAPLVRLGALSFGLAGRFFCARRATVQLNMSAPLTNRGAKGIQYSVFRSFI